MDDKTYIKYSKILGDDQMEELEQLDRSGLKATIVRCTNNIYETEEAQDADEKLARLKAEKSNAEAPYKDAIKVQRAKRAVANILLQEAGGGE